LLRTVMTVAKEDREEGKQVQIKKNVSTQIMFCKLFGGKY